MSKLQLVTKGTAERWAGQICTQLSKSVEAIIATGRLLVEAKADLDHGEWGRMFEAKLIPLSQDAAEMFMKIAQHPRLSNSEQVRNLPSSYTTLYELTKLPDKALDKAFKEGRITPAMERKEVQALMPVARSARPAPSPRASTRADEPEPKAAAHPKARTELDQALDEGRQWMRRWAHIAQLASVFDAITQLLEKRYGQ
jgi:Protein of unknown function (DUF3102)